jgi:glutaconate CoA-transferase subunit B
MNQLSNAKSKRTSGTSIQQGNFSIDEWFVVLLARTIRDREVVFHGFGSPCAQVAMHVARHTHARDMLLVEGATYALNPDPPFIPPTGNDLSLQQGAAYRMRFEEFFDAALRGDVDRMFLSGGQIDPYGNTNVTSIGGIDHPKVKLGGGGGGCNLSATIGHLSLWTTRHRSGRTLVERCDFVTDMGHRTPQGTHAELGFTGGGPEYLITELGVFDYDDDGHARLRQVFPDVRLDEVRAATGFELRVAANLQPVPLPSTAELAALRAVDPLGVRRSEFSPQELHRTFTFGESAGCVC